MPGPLHDRKIFRLDTAQVVEITGAVIDVADAARNMPLFTGGYVASKPL